MVLIVRIITKKSFIERKVIGFGFNYNNYKSCFCDKFDYSKLKTLK